MVKKIKTHFYIVIILFQFYSFFGYAQNGSSKILAGYKDANWGQTKEEIEKNEKLDLAFAREGEEPEVLGYMTADYSPNKNGGLLLYFFSNNQLMSAILNYETEIGNESYYLDDFQNKKEELIFNYGKPDRDTVFFDNARNTEKSDWPDLLQKGNLLIICNWFYENGQIVLSLGNINTSDKKLDYKLEFLTNKFLDIKKPKN